MALRLELSQELSQDCCVALISNFKDRLGPHSAIYVPSKVGCVFSVIICLNTIQYGTLKTA
jgi:hypothetical protein